MKRRTGGETKSNWLAVRRRSRGLVRKEHGATAIEYAVLLGILALVAVGSILAFSKRTKSLHTSLARDVAGTITEFNKYSMDDVSPHATRDRQP